jgi:hypothetical protein
MFGINGSTMLTVSKVYSLSPGQGMHPASQTKGTVEKPKIGVHQLAGAVFLKN